MQDYERGLRDARTNWSECHRSLTNKLAKHSKLDDTDLAYVTSVVSSMDKSFDKYIDWLERRLATRDVAIRIVMDEMAERKPY